MKLPPIVQRHPSLRWLAPIAVVGVAGLAATGMFRAEATSEKLPATSPAALIAAVQAPEAPAFSGTVVSRLSLGLPELPHFGPLGDGASLPSLLSGSHTLQVWYGGADQQRITLLGETDETDLFRSGRQLWQWTSADRVAVHAVLPKEPAAARAKAQAAPTERLTPSGLAKEVLDDLDPSTAITVKHDTEQVANRSAYELVLRPRTTDTLVGAVHIAVDGKTKLPLGIQVYARGSRTPSIDVAYTSIRFSRPPSTYFSFMPPAGATVHTLHPKRSTHGGSGTSRSGGPLDDRLDTAGTGWSTVWTYRAGPVVTELKRSSFRQAFTRVSGSWGKGRLLTSDLVSVLVTDDGRVLVGAVDPDALYAAAK